jgi:hypothetical protein
MSRAFICRSIVLLVSRSSACAYGEGFHFVLLWALYPDAWVVFLGDSGQGVTTTEFEHVRNTSWNDQLPASVFGPDATTTPDTQVVAKLAAVFLKDCFSQLWRRARRTSACSRRPDRQGVSTNTY